MAKKIVTLYIDDASIRLMVTSGRQIKAWAESPLEPGLVANNVVVNQAEVTNRIKQLLATQNIKARKISLGISGMRCLTRPIMLPELPKEMLPEALRREADRLLPVPLEQLYISWQSVPAPEGKALLFLTAIPRISADALIKALHKAGLEPSFMDVKPLILTKITGEPTAIIVDVQRTEFDIVIMVNGIPQPVRTISFASEALPLTEKMITVTNELERTTSFYNSNNPDNTLAPAVNIFVSGELMDEPELCRSLTESIGHQVLALPTLLECPEGLDRSRFMVNIGLTQEKLPANEQVRKFVVNLNALPVPYQPKPVSIVNILTYSFAAIAIVLIAALFLFLQNTADAISSIQDQTVRTEKILQQQLTQQQEFNTSISQMENDIKQADRMRTNFAAAVGSIEKQSEGINHDLETTMISLPSSISLRNINHNGLTMTIRGLAPAEKNILAYIEKLDTSGRFGEITIITLERTETGELAFTLLGSLQKYSNLTSSIEIALINLPSTIGLTGFTSDEGILTISGTAPNENEVLAYLKVLEDTGEYSEITVTNMTATEEGETSFSFLLKAEE